MDDVFDTSGRPVVEGVIYYFRSVGTWSGPENPIAVCGLAREYSEQHPEDNPEENEWASTAMQVTRSRPSGQGEL